MLFGLKSNAANLERGRNKKFSHEKSLFALVYGYLLIFIVKEFIKLSFPNVHLSWSFFMTKVVFSFVLVKIVQTKKFLEK